MLIAIDKRGSINLPLALRRELGLENGTYLELEVVKGGGITLHPVSIYPNLRLSDQGLAKLKAARESGTGKLPEWLIKEMKSARAHPDKKIS
jgi:AbrB family looped-hinge helix DNA binding protein